MTIDTARLRALAEANYELKDADGDVQGREREAVILTLIDEIERLRGAVEWEYAPSWRLNQPSTDRYQFDCAPSELVRRRKAGPWEPVEGDGDE